MRSVRAVRYVLPFRQGGSVPALVEADDLGFYVVKLRGAGQGHKALVAELVAGELARAAGLLVPDLALVELDAALAASEPDPELSIPLEASAGLNLGLDYLPGSITFDPVAGVVPDATTASRIVLFDALVANVDRTARNANLLQWHKRIWLIDHGASLYFHHGWGPKDPLDGAQDPFVMTAQHVLLRWAKELPAAAKHLEKILENGLVERVVGEIPESWLRPEDGFADPAAHRAAYVDWFRARLAAMPLYLEEANVPTQPSFDYAIVRIVPRVEREEFLNVGVIVFCPDRGFLKAVIELDEARLQSLSPGVDLELVRDHLQAFAKTCEGGPGSGPIGALPIRERWSWLVAPRSTILQTSAPHVGLCQSPELSLERLLDQYVRLPKL